VFYVLLVLESIGKKKKEKRMYESSFVEKIEEGRMKVRTESVTACSSDFTALGLALNINPSPFV
jgi:hypothetical protein